MNRLVVLLAACCLQLCGVVSSQADDSDPIRKRLNEARAAYDKAMMDYTAEAAKWFAAEDASARKLKTGVTEKVKLLADEKKEFDNQGTFPKRVDKALREKPSKAAEVLVKAYKTASDEYSRQKKDDLAEAVEKELAEFQDSPQVVAFLSDWSPIRLKLHNKWFTTDGRVFGRQIVVEGKASPHGILLHPPERGFSEAVYKLNRPWDRFRSGVAVPSLGDAAEAKGMGSEVTFEVLGDAKSLWKSNASKEFGKSQPCDIGIIGVQVLTLRVHCAGSSWCARTVWLEPRVSARR